MSVVCSTYSHDNSWSNYLFQTSLDQLKRSVTKTALHHPSSTAWLKLLLSCRAVELLVEAFIMIQRGHFNSLWVGFPSRDENLSLSFQVSLMLLAPRSGYPDVYQGTRPKKGNKITRASQMTVFYFNLLYFWKKSKAVLSWDTKANNQNIFVGGKSLKKFHFGRTQTFFQLVSRAAQLLWLPAT